MASSRVNIAIIEPSDIIRIGIEHIVDSRAQLSITHSDSELITILREDVDILIINMDKLIAAGIHSIRGLYPNADVVAIVYGYASPEHRAFADRVIEIYDSPTRVLEVLSHGLEHQEVASIKSETGELSEREMEIVAAVARGLINKEIADSLNISIHTVMAHRKNISRKTGIRSISGLVVYALLNGLIEQSEVLK